MTVYTLKNQFSLEAEVDYFRSERLMAVIRTEDAATGAEDALWAARQLIKAGFRILDVTYGTPEAERVIETLSAEFPNILIGAGTVLTPRQAMSALASGARFLASPVFDSEMIQFGADHHVLILPGVATPTEMYAAMHAGAKLLKFFPAEPIGGAQYLKTVLAPLPELPVIATGGIDIANMADYWQAGAMAVGVGGQLMPTEILKARDEELMARHAAQYLAKRDQFKQV